MRYLGLDLGTRTLGIALSDNTALIASSLKTIRFNEEDYESLLPELKDIINEFNIKNIVLGLPKNMNNSLGFASERSLNFKKLLEENFDVNVYMQDERLSSVEANNIMIGADLSRKKRKKNVDALAASIILQSYLDSRKEDK
jgi:putative Holliday junction resolvase